MKERLRLSHYPFDLNDLPSGWEVVTVGEVLRGVQPGFASGKHNSNGEGVPHLRPMNISRDRCLDFTAVKSVTSGRDLRLHRGDVLFNNTNSPELVGKTARVDVDADLAS